MLGSFSLVALGFLLGMRHALDPDHVVAIGTIATRSTSFGRAARTGALWGLGHTLTLLVVGGTIVTLRTAVSPRTGVAMELAVAVMLIVLGVLNLLNARRAEPTAPSAARPMVVGMVHGMAGSAAVALLVLAAIREPTVGMLYLLLFGLGTIAGMMLVTGLLVLPVSLVVMRVGVSRRWLTAATGMVSLVFGVLMVRALGSLQGLFSADIGWISR
jgi:high-affinity nickel-transport protein